MPWDHPRRCGAFRRGRQKVQLHQGSSPQVRGISSGSDPRSCIPGIIPAGAGHLFSQSLNSGISGDHPRRCGAFLFQRALPDLCLGSSPQVRGIYRKRAGSRKRPGIIPAGAGHFLNRVSMPASVWDHPRRCGAFTR